VLAQLAARHKGILLFHDIQPSTAHAIRGILDELKARGFKVVHIVPKTPVATLADYDTRAAREIASRKQTTEKQPLAPRSLVWSQTGSAKSSGETLPWEQPSAASRQPTTTKASNEDATAPWYKQWLLP
jgi:hypothetical protein